MESTRQSVCNTACCMYCTHVHTSTQSYYNEYRRCRQRARSFQELWWCNTSNIHSPYIFRFFTSILLLLLLLLGVLCSVAALSVFGVDGTVTVPVYEAQRIEYGSGNSSSHQPRYTDWGSAIRWRCGVRAYLAFFCRRWQCKWNAFENCANLLCSIAAVMYYYTATIIGARSRALRGENCFATKIHREYEKYSVYALSHNDDDDDAYLQTRGARARAIAPRVCRFVVEKRTQKKTHRRFEWLLLEFEQSAKCLLGVRMNEICSLYCGVLWSAGGSIGSAKRRTPSNNKLLVVPLCVLYSHSAGRVVVSGAMFFDCRGCAPKTNSAFNIIFG